MKVGGFAAGGLCLVLAGAGGAGFAASKWPFQRGVIEKELERRVGAPVKIGRFRKTWLPHPGCVAETVTARSEAIALSIGRLSIEGSYSSFLRGRKEIAHVRIEDGLLQWRSKPRTQGASPTVVHEYAIERSVFEREPPEKGKEPLRIGMHRATLRQQTSGGPMFVEGSFRYPKPEGELWVRGRIDSLNGLDTPVSGEYRYEHAKLGAFEGIDGELSAHGKFSGPLRAVEIDGTTSVPDFQVKQSTHRLKLEAAFRAVVDGSNGDTLLEPVETVFGATHIHWTGSLRGNGGKEAALEMISERARIQDLLFLVLRSNPPPMAGPVNFRAHVVLPPDGAKFLERLRLDGDFGIEGHFDSPGMRKGVAELSARARGEKQQFDDPENVIADLRAHVRVRRGVATLTGVSFRTPGALAYLNGTYNLISQRIDLRGQLRTEAQLSQTTKGLKSFLLKAVDPFYKRKGAGAVIPVSIGGTYSHPVFTALGMRKTGHGG